MKDYEMQKKFLEEIKNDVNVVLSSIIHQKVELDINEDSVYRYCGENKKIDYSFESSKDFSGCCGIMTSCFKNANIYSDITWNEDYMIISFKFKVEFNTVGFERFPIKSLCVKYKDKLVTILR